MLIEKEIKQQVPSGEKILSLLIDLLADQNKAKVKYIVKAGNDDVSHR